MIARVSFPYRGCSGCTHACPRAGKTRILRRKALAMTVPLLKRRPRRPGRLRHGAALVLALAFALAGLGVRAASTAVPPALAEALVRDPDVAPCAERSHAASSVAYVGANFQLANVALASGPRLVVVSGGGECVCGNANCKVEVFEHDGNAYKPVLSDYAIDWKVRPDGTATITSHDSAAVVFRTTYRWSGRKYSVTKSEMVYVPSNVAKPASREVKF